MWQNLLVGFIVLFAVVFTVYRFVTRKSCACGDACCNDKKAAGKNGFPGEGDRRCRQSCAGNGKCCREK